MCLLAVGIKCDAVDIDFIDRGGRWGVVSEIEAITTGGFSTISAECGDALGVDGLFIGSNGEGITVAVGEEENGLLVGEGVVGNAREAIGCRRKSAHVADEEPLIAVVETAPAGIIDGWHLARGELLGACGGNDPVTCEISASESFCLEDVGACESCCFP